MSQQGQGGYVGAGFQIDIPYPLIAIKNIQVNRAFNDHSRCELTVVMTEETAIACLEKGSFKDTIQIRRERDSGTQYWFSGGITGVDINVEDGIWHVIIQATSRTYDMDHKRKSRSYQNKNKTYTSLIKELVAPYRGGGAMNEATHPDAKIGELLVQYEETDWEFLRRLASKVGTVILPDVVMDAPRVYFGVPDFSWGTQLEEVYYTVTQNQERTLRVEGSHQDISYTVHSEQYVQVGDNVSFHGQMWVVYEAKMNYHEGITVHTYQLVQRETIRSMVKQNHRIQGVSLGGKVIDRGNNMVKVHLDVDDQHDEGGNWWFPYSSEGNNMFHALPEQGARINVYFPGGKEKQAIAINSVRGKNEEMKGRTVFQKPNTKAFHIPGNAKMELGEDGVLFEKNTVRLHLNANDISLEADENLMIIGAEGIELGSQGRMPDYIKMRAETSITLFTGEQSIEILTQRTAIKGKEMNLNKVEMSLLDMLNEEDLEDLYVDSLMTEAEDEFKAEKKGEMTVYIPSYGRYDREKELEITPAEKDQIRAKVKAKVRQDPDQHSKAKASASKRGIEDLTFHYKMVSKKEGEGQNPLSSEEKKRAMHEYNDFYQSYVDGQKRIREQEKRAEMNRMDKLTDRNPQEALRQESDMLRASARSQERNQDVLSSGKEPSLGTQLVTAFLDWYNLSYIVPQKPNYLSKDQSEDTRYSRYFIEQFVISVQKAEAERNKFWGGVEVGIAAIAVIIAVPTMGLSVYLGSIAGIATMASFAHGATQETVASLKLSELAEGNYHTPELDKWQKGLDISGTAIAVIDLAMLGKSAASGVRNLANDTKRAAMLTKIKNPALKQGLDKIGTKLGQTGSKVAGAYDDAKSALNIGKTGQLGLDVAGAGAKAGKTGSQAVKGTEAWYSSGGKGGNPRIGTDGASKALNVGSVVKDGNKTKYTNPAGNELTWFDQHPKNIGRDIETFLNSPNIGKATEGKVAKFVSEQKEVTAFGQKVQRADKTPAGDFDVLTKDEIIEVKASAGALKVDQIEKYTKTSHKDFLNPENKRVIVYIEEPLVNLAPEQLQKLNKIKNMGAIVVNSLEELKGVLK